MPPLFFCPRKGVFTMNTKDWTISAIITIVGGLFVAVVGGLLLHAILNKLNKKTPTNKINNKEKAQNIPTDRKSVV